MMEWTPAAKKCLTEYVEKKAAELTAVGADCGEVRNDLSDHIQTRVHEAGRTVVTEEDVLYVVGKASGTAGAGAADSRAVPPPLQPAPATPPLTIPCPRPLGWFVHSFVILFGIILPIITLGVELSTGMCADAFFDPIPTVMHTLLVALVPVANLLVLRSVQQRPWLSPRLTALFCGAAAGVSAFYALQFLPITPFACIGIMFMGLGFLGLSPLLAFLAGILLWRKLKKQEAEVREYHARCRWLAVTGAVLLLLLLEIPAAVTFVGASMAASGSQETAMNGVSLLRRAGSREQLLRMCYQRGGGIRDTAGMLYALAEPPSPEQVRGTYYRVTGESFSSQPPPRLRFGRGRAFDDWDPDQGGSVTGKKLHNLFLHSSRLDASVDADGGVVYTEWTLEFRNDGGWQQEARTVVQLPPGGCVSRLTLWIDGEPREAAFAGRHEVKEAYQKVVQRRRDPVLVTSAGPDRVMVQCFPVPANGIMKIRLGITAPMPVTRPELGELLLPRFIENNFRLKNSFAHKLWVEAKTPVLCPGVGLTQEKAAEKLFAVRGDVSQAALQAGVVIQGQRNLAVTTAWTEDKRATPPRRILQELAAVTTATVPEVILVVDASVSLKPFAETMAKALAELKAIPSVTLIVADDLAPRTVLTRSRDPQAVAKALRAVQFLGGRDNLPALQTACETARRTPGAVIAWLHGPQPLEITPFAGLAQEFARRGASAPIFDIQVAPGQNVLVNELANLGALTPATRTAVTPDTLSDLLARLGGSRQELRWRRTSADSVPAVADSAKQTSDHLARLYALDEINALAPFENVEARQKAIRIAADYRLVTTVSGAVVLESQAQYKEAGLEPVSADTVPTIPEPETWAMLIVAAVVLLYLAFRRKLATAAAEQG